MPTKTLSTALAFYCSVSRPGCLRDDFANLTSLHVSVSGIEMDVFTDVSETGVMSEEQQQRFFKEASDAVYRAKGNLTPEQQVSNIRFVDLKMCAIVSWKYYSTVIFRYDTFLLRHVAW